MSTKTDELRESCMALYLALPQEIADDFTALVKGVIEESEMNAFYIECLHGGGVDNWEWYEEALQDYFERYNDG